LTPFSLSPFLLFSPGDDRGNSKNELTPFSPALLENELTPFSPAGGNSKNELTPFSPEK